MTDTTCHCGNPAAIDVAHHRDRPCLRHPDPFTGGRPIPE